jgi:hypothetical protein
VRQSPTEILTHGDGQLVCSVRFVKQVWECTVCNIWCPRDMSIPVGSVSRQCFSLLRVQFTCRNLTRIFLITNVSDA